MARFLYSVLLAFLLPFALLRLYVRGFREPRYRQRWTQRLGFIPVSEPGQTIWLHAVSVGEVRAAIPLVRALLERYPACRLHITTTTPTGAATLEQLFSGQVSHSYFPYDLPWSVGQYLERLRPVRVLVMETEIWPNLFYACARRDIPLCLLNARLSETSLQAYRRVSGLMAKALQQVTMIAARSEADRRRWLTLGADAGRVTVVGNLKFDLVVEPSTTDQAAEWRRRWGNTRRVWVAGSTHPGEDRQVLKAQQRLLRTQPAALLILVPRHPERAGDIMALCQQLDLNSLLSGQANRLDESVQVLVGDRLGELAVFYQACETAFIGGSLVPHGGQNPLEAVVAGVPVVTGKHTENFADVYQLLAAANAVVTVKSSAQLADTTRSWFEDPAAAQVAVRNAREVLEQNTGATQRTLVLLQRLLSAACSK